MRSIKARIIISGLIFIIFLFAILPAQSFADAPPVVTGDTSSITTNSANLGYSVDPMGSSPNLDLASEGVEWATDAYYTANGSTYNGNSSSVPVYQNSGHGGYFNASSLSCGTLYHYRAYVVTNGNETGYGGDMTFTTSPCGQSVVGFDGGDGSHVAPYQISNCAQLQAMNQALTKVYVLKNNVDCAATNPADPSFDATGEWGNGEGFVPVGSDIVPFTGTFDGAGYTIQNLYIHRTSGSRTGLFGGFSGTVSNLHLSAVSVQGVDDTGALVGFIYNGGSINTVTIDSGTVTGATSTGGLVGYNQYGTISSASSAASVTGTTEVGGLIGTNDGGTVSDSYATGTTSGGDKIGGFVGNNGGGTIERAYATGDVNASHTGTYAGGFAGQATGDISYAFARGDVVGGTTVGGFIGELSDGTISYASARGDVSGYGSKIGGFTGSNAGTITQAYAAGSVNGLGTTGSPFSVGGFAGDQVHVVASSFAASLVTVTNRYIQVGGFAGYSSGSTSDTTWWTGSYPTAYGSGGVSMTGIGSRLQFKDKTSEAYTGWDFDSVWDMATGDYPVLNAGWPTLRSLSSGYVNESGDGIPDGTPTPVFAGGNGSSESPYLIDSCTQFSLINDHLGSSYRLTQDLNCNAYGNEVTVGGTIGGDIGSFSGVFDGAGHSVTVDIEDQEGNGVGLFRTVSGAVIKDLTIGEGSGVIGASLVGSIAGAAFDTQFLRVHSSALVYSLAITFSFPYAGTGGIVGETFGGEIDGSSFSGIAASPVGVGGIVGFTLNDMGSGPGTIISRSWNTGQVYSGFAAGGVVGYLAMGSSVRNSYNAGSVMYSEELAQGIPVTGSFGGLVGSITQGLISRSYSAGTGSDFGAGTLYPSGSLVGTVTDAEIVHSFSATHASAEPDSGGFVGALLDGSLELFNNYFDTAIVGKSACLMGDTEPRTDCTGADGSTSGFWKNTNRQPLAFWNATDVWDFTTDGDFPVLRPYVSAEPSESDERVAIDGGETPVDSHPHMSTKQSILNRVKRYITEGDTDQLKKYVEKHGKDLQKYTGQGATLPAEVKMLLEKKPELTEVTTPAVTVRNLSLLMIGDDVLALQKLLNANGFVIASSGPGSVGHETAKFGLLTKKAVLKFQKQYGIVPATGTVGPLTRAKMKALGWSGLW